MQRATDRSTARVSAGGEATRRRSDAFAARVFPTIQIIRAEGHTSLNAIANQLNARAVSTDRGGKWTSTSVKNLLARTSS
jgi:hypothetical protein